MVRRVCWIPTLGPVSRSYTKNLASPNARRKKVGVPVLTSAARCFAVHEPPGSGQAARALGARRADGATAQEINTSGRGPARTAAHVSDRGRRVYRPVYIAV